MRDRIILSVGAIARSLGSACTMRILEVIESFGAGSMQVVLTISDRAAAAGHQVAIAHGSVPETPADPRSSVSPDIELYPLPWRREAVSQLSAAGELRRLHRAWRPDVVHLHSSFAGMIGVLTLPRGARLVYTPHGYSFIRHGGVVVRPWIYLMLERFIARHVLLVGAVSESEADLARRRIGAPRVQVVANGIPELDNPVVRPIQKRGTPSIIAIGRVGPARSPVAAARILSKLADVAPATWVGGGDVDDEGTAALRDAGIPITGWLEHVNALEYLARATACLHWSAWDAQPLAVLEAMAHDVVVVASDIPANRELLGPRQVCSTEDAAVQLLRAVITEPALRVDLLAEQRKRRTRYSADRMVTDWLGVYRRLCG
jgi:glycosyltransferase involved in cell wall biosynthesis